MGRSQIQTIISILSAFVLVLMMVFGGFYYQSAIKDLRQEVLKDSELKAARITRLVSTFILKDADIVRSIAGMDTFKRALRASTSSAIAEANQLLSHFRYSIDADVCYIMTLQGTTIASSNYEDSGSFIGKNFAFRPYFKFHYDNSLVTYLAVGTTTGIRGAFHSFPVRHDGKNIGLAVLKQKHRRFGRTVIVGF